MYIVVVSLSTCKGGTKIVDNKYNAITHEEIRSTIANKYIMII